MTDNSNVVLLAKAIAENKKHDEKTIRDVIEKFCIEQGIQIYSTRSHTEENVKSDMNSLIKQMKCDGILVPYRPPHYMFYTNNSELHDLLKENIHQGFYNRSPNADGGSKCQGGYSVLMTSLEKFRELIKDYNVMNGENDGGIVSVKSTTKAVKKSKAKSEDSEVESEAEGSDEEQTPKAKSKAKPAPKKATKKEEVEDSQDEGTDNEIDDDDVVIESEEEASEDEEKSSKKKPAPKKAPKAKPVAKKAPAKKAPVKSKAK